MGSPRGGSAFVRRLEDRIASELAGRDAAVLAYSGGLACTLVAMVARKRCDLTCVVAGVEDSPDMRAAKIAKDYLDYRMEYIILSREDARRIRRRVAALHPRLPARELDALVPLHAVLERDRDRFVVSGFGSPRLSNALASVLRRAGVKAPLHSLAGANPLPRATIRTTALALGLPSDWAATRHRTPAAGAGIERFLHEVHRRST